MSSCPGNQKIRPRVNMQILSTVDWEKFWIKMIFDFQDGGKTWIYIYIAQFYSEFTRLE